MRNKLFVVASLLIIASMVLGACAQPTPAPAQPGVTEVVKTVEVIVEGTPMVVTATPPPPPPAQEFTSSDPSTFVTVTFGEAETFDPALDYETAGGEIIQNVYETLIFYEKDKPADYIAQLATEVPSLENGGISADGLTYTFNIREGVKFHNGNDLTPSDVAYSFQRGILQGGTASPQWLFTEPFFAIGIHDIAEVVEAAQAAGVEALNTETVGALSEEALAAVTAALDDDPEAVKAVDPAVLAAVCERTKAAIVADDAAGTVTMHLAVPWAPFLATLAGFWGSVMDQDWVIENGGWDGDCATWQNFYGITSENNPFTAIANGTGPFKLDHWTQGQEIVLVRNDDYWRTEPAWEGGPSGPAALERVVIKKVDEWGTRFAMMQAGDADFATVNPDAYSQIDPLAGELCAYNNDAGDFDACQPTDNPDAPLRLWQGQYRVTRTDAFLTFQIATEGGNPFVGSGVLDGNGIPPDFFMDEHVRRAFNYCFDWDIYIDEGMAGEGVKSIGIPLPGMPGYDPNGPTYSFDLAKCEEEFKASTLTSPDGQSLWDVGFRMQVAYNTGNTQRQTIAEILAANLSQVNELFQVEIIGLPWPTFLRSQRAQILPMFFSGWVEDIHDPHNWYQPYIIGTYGRRQNLPEDITAEFAAMINAGVAESDPEARNQIYAELNQKIYELAPQIILAIPTGRNYLQRWVEGYFRNPIHSQFYYYAFSKK